MSVLMLVGAAGARTAEVRAPLRHAAWAHFWLSTIESFHNQSARIAQQAPAPHVVRAGAFHQCQSGRAEAEVDVWRCGTTVHPVASRLRALCQSILPATYPLPTPFSNRFVWWRVSCLLWVSFLR